MKTQVTTTALGWIIIIKPVFETNEWELVFADRNGCYKGGQLGFKTEQNAKEGRTKMFKLHKNLAKKWQQKRKKNADQE